MGFLEEIVRAVREEISRPSYLGELPAVGPAARPSLRAAVERDTARGAVLVEYKRASPGRPDPVLPARSVPEFVESVRRAGVTGYSCLATRSRFDGSPADVAELARSSDRPLLFKDFVVDPRQVEAARRAGASAVLLIARLGREGHLEHSLAELSRAAHDVGLEVVLEFHGKAELSEAAGVAADMYGVNVRDLDTLRLERETAETTIAGARDRGFRPLLGLSGVEGPEDAGRFWRAGVDGILVGTAVARASDPAAFLDTLRAARSGGPR